MAELPSGTVTFLFTDLVGSTRLWEQDPEAMKAALARHDAILRNAVARHGGSVVKMTGDGIHAAFEDAVAGVSAARDAQLAFARESWATPEPLRVRMGLHTGSAELREGDYFGTAVNRAARLMGAAHGGQVIVSLTTEELLRDVGADGWELIDLGEHRLRDLQRAERLFQLSVDGLEVDFPRLRSLDAYPTNLPIQLSSFVGRDAELAAVQKALDQSRAVTLTGVGGSGKTRLAIQVGAEVLPRFPDGVWLCELAPATNADVLAQIVAVALGVRLRAGVRIEDSIVGFLGNRTALVVLDNCEHLVDAAGRLGKVILSNCGGVRVLATSREGLGLEGERVLAVHSLSVPDMRADPVDIAATDAVRLFSERAEAARSGFSIDETNGRSVAEICRRLDGMPLAIELAAARVAAMRPVEIAALLDERFRLLAGGRRTAVARHQTLRATVDWSYSLLDERDRIVFERLSVFAGSFDAASATAVVSDDRVERWDVLDAVVSLVAKSMLVDLEAPDGTTRYSMLETLREYAVENLNEIGEVDIWRRRHAAHYAPLAAEVGRGMRGPDEFAWRRRFKEELDNVRAAVDWALDAAHPGDVDLGWQIIAGLSLEVLGDQSAGIGGLAERAVQRHAASGPAVRSDVRSAAAWHAFEQADFEQAAEHASAAISVEPLHDANAVGVAYVVLSAAHAHRLDLDRSHAVIDEGLQTLEQLQDRVGEVVLTVWAAFLGTLEGDFATARDRAEQGLTAAREVGNPTLIAGALCGYGRATWHEDPDAALTACAEAIDLMRAGANSAAFSDVLLVFAVLTLKSDPTAALTALREALKLNVSLNDMTQIAACAHRGAVVFEATGATLEAAVLLGAAQGTLDAIVAVDAIERAEEQQLVERLRNNVGNDEFKSAATRGATMSPTELVNYALDVVHRSLQQRVDV